MHVCGSVEKRGIVRGRSLTGSQQGADRLSPCLAVHGNGEVISAPEPSRLPSSFAAPQGRPHIVAASAVLGRPHMFAASAARSSEER